MGPDITHCGPVGCGQIAKILNNMVVFQNGVALAEAITIGQQAGMDGGDLLEIINKSSGGSFVGMNHGIKSMVPGTFPLKAVSGKIRVKGPLIRLASCRRRRCECQRRETRRRNARVSN